MMHKITAFCLFALMLLSSPSLLAQEVEAPNYDQIRIDTYNSKSPSYYPTLFQRYQEGDSTLSLEDYRNLYFGFSLREDFVPYKPENEELLTSRQKLIRNSAAPEDCPEAIQTALNVLQDNPFDLVALSILSICHYQLGDTTSCRLWDSKLHGVLDAIGSTGDGIEPQSAFHVISVDHEYEIINRLGLELEQVEVSNSQIDFVRVKQNPDSIQGLYFNFGAASSIYRTKYK